MCLTSTALAAFLSLIGPSHVTLGDDVIIVHATTADAVWTARGETWCTDAPRQPVKTTHAKKH